MLQKEALLRQIMNTFNLSPDEAEAALLLLDTRAANLDMSLDDYMQTYHPAGFSQKDATLNNDYKGYVQFLAQDAKAIIKTGKTADFSTFVHENAHIFRRQLAGDLKAKAETGRVSRKNILPSVLKSISVYEWLKARIYGKYSSAVRAVCSTFTTGLTVS